jgi:hypothetical protein
MLWDRFRFTPSGGLRQCLAGAFVVEWVRRIRGVGLEFVLRSETRILRAGWFLLACWRDFLRFVVAGLRVVLVVPRLTLGSGRL